MDKFSKSALVVAVSAVIGATNGQAAGNGSPKGKPFVAINDQVVEVQGAVTSLQDQIDLLVGRVDSIEQRVGANEDTIAALEAQNAALDVLVQQNLSDIASIEAEIVALEQANADLEAQILANSGNIEVLQGQVAVNSGIIGNLQQAIILVNDSIIALGTSLQGQIDNNLALIGALQDEIAIINENLALKQNLVDGTCPNGSAVQEILTDGSVICQSVGGVSGQLESVNSYQVLIVSQGSREQVFAYCPPDYVVTGAGFSGYNFNMISSFAENNYGYVDAINVNTYSAYLYSVATCTRIVP